MTGDSKAGTETPTEVTKDATLDAAGGSATFTDTRTGRSFLRGALTFLLYTAFFLLVILALPKVISVGLGTPYPMATITSNSMWPALREGDLVFVESVSPEEIKVGAVVVYRSGPGFVIHRVIKTQGGRIVTQGDANTTPDQPLSYDRIVGKVPVIWGRLAKVPYLGYITFLTRKKPAP